MGQDFLVLSNYSLLSFKTISLCLFLISCCCWGVWAYFLLLFHPLVMTCDLYFNVGPTLIRFLCFGVFSFAIPFCFSSCSSIWCPYPVMYDKELSLGLEILCNAVLPGCSLVRHRGLISRILGTIGKRKKKELFNVLTLRKVVLPWPPRLQGWAELRQSFSQMSPRDFWAKIRWRIYLTTVFINSNEYGHRRKLRMDDRGRSDRPIGWGGSMSIIFDHSGPSYFDHSWKMI